MKKFTDPSDDDFDFDFDFDFDDDEFWSADFEDEGDEPEKFDGQYSLLTISACGDWDGEREVFSPSQAMPMQVLLPRAFASDLALRQAATLLGVSLTVSRVELKARLRRLAQRYPPEQFPEKNAAFREAAALIHNPLKCMSERMQRDCSTKQEGVESNAVSLRPPLPSAGLQALKSWLGQIR